MPKTTSIEVTVPPTIVPRVVDLGKLQAPNLFKALRVEIFMGAPDLKEVCIT